MPERTDVEIVPATAADVAEFFDGPPPFRMRARAGKLNGETLGVGGLYFLPDGTRAGFLAVKPAARKLPVTLCRVAKQFLADLARQGVSKVIAVADPAVPSAERFLVYLGFRPVATHDDQVVYQWP